jgi:PAS domain S-box-containing protein
MYTAIAKAKTDLQKILDFSLDVICTIDSKDKFVTVSAASKELWGYDPKELIGRCCLDIVYEGDRQATLQHVELLKTDPTKTYCENRICKKDGEVVTIAWSAYWDEDEEILYCVARGADKKRKVEKLLIESEEQLRFAQKLARIGNWYLDLATEETNWSEGIYDIYGLSKEKIPAPTLEIFFELIHPEDRQAAHQEFNNLLKADKSDFVHRLVKPDGKTIYVRHLSQAIRNEQNETIALTGTVQDITEQKEAEIKLALSEQKFKSLVQNGSDIIAILDEGGNFQYVSPTSLRIAGYDPNDLIGKNALQMIHPDDVHEVVEKLQDVINFTNDGIPTQFRFVDKKGEWVWLEALGSNLEGNSKEVVINARDITERKKLEAQLTVEQKNRQRAITSAVIKAQESERSQLGQELHDNVNQVLTTVKLYNEMLFDGIGDPKDILEKSIHHLQSCINEIRSISKRLSAPTLGKISLEDSIKELVDSINLTKRLHISFQITGANNKIIPQDLHLAIYRIIQEQLNNIIKYAEAGNVLIQIHNCGEGLLLQIEDDGKGFDTQKKRKGIGITNMETRAENMHGKLKLISTPGHGCKLIAKFPALQLQE